MAKQEAEWAHALNIFWLRKKGFLEKGNQKNGTITWSYGSSKSSAVISVSLQEEGFNSIELTYLHTSSATGEKSEMRYLINLATTKCNYGGKRYWFVCGLVKNGEHCGKRVGALYMMGKWFGCRYCTNIAYHSQNKSGKYRGSSITDADIEKFEKGVKRSSYNGKPTRKYRRLMIMKDKVDNDILMFGAMLNPEIKRIVDFKKHIASMMKK